jgi:hypothetical protein
MLSRERAGAPGVLQNQLAPVEGSRLENPGGRASRTPKDACGYGGSSCPVTRAASYWQTRASVASRVSAGRNTIVCSTLELGTSHRPEGYEG